MPDNTPSDLVTILLDVHSLPNDRFKEIYNFPGLQEDATVDFENTRSIKIRTKKPKHALAIVWSLEQLGYSITEDRKDDEFVSMIIKWVPLHGHRYLRNGGFQYWRGGRFFNYRNVSEWRMDYPMFEGMTLGRFELEE